MRVTAYCACNRCCGPHAAGVTASGQRVTADGGAFVAADPAVLPFGSRVVVPGYPDPGRGGRPVRVLDTGSAIRGARLDVFFPSHGEALRWGVRRLEVLVLTEESP